VVWAISPAHHWAGVVAGLRELHRVLERGGRLIIAERLAHPSAPAMPRTDSPSRRPPAPQAGGTR
jgi:ubiquinone/menaquinone biosynthesis C-methylase UbiE